MIRTIALLLIAVSSFGQSLTLASGVTSSGGTLNLNLTLAGSSTVAGLEWAFSFPPTVITSSVTPGLQATLAGKSVACAQVGVSYVCLVSGLNTNQILNGVVAVLTVTVSGDATIGVIDPLGATQVGIAIMMTSAGGTIGTLSPAVLSISKVS